MVVYPPLKVVAWDGGGDNAAQIATLKMARVLMFPGLKRTSGILTAPSAAETAKHYRL